MLIMGRGGGCWGWGIEAQRKLLGNWGGSWLGLRGEGGRGVRRWGGGVNWEGKGGMGEL